MQQSVALAHSRCLGFGASAHSLACTGTLLTALLDCRRAGRRAEFVLCKKGLFLEDGVFSPHRMCLERYLNGPQHRKAV